MITTSARLTQDQRRNVRHNIKVLRQSKGWSQRELARLTGSSSAHISLIESGGRNPSSHYAKDLAKSFRVSFFKFIDMKMHMKVLVR